MPELRSSRAHRATRPNVARHAGVVVSATFASRILGYIRDMLIAWSFGAGLYTDAFIVAFRIPNLFRRLVGEGALGMAFIPVFQDHVKRRGRRQALDLAVVTFRRLALLLAIVVFFGVMASPAIVRGLAPGFATPGEAFHLAVNLTRIMFPYVLLVGLVAMSMGVLNALGHFSAPALAPLVLNIAMITAIVVGVCEAPTMAARAQILAAGVVVGGVLQCALQMPALRRHGLRLGSKTSLEPGVLGRFGRSALPVMLGGATYQINVLLGTLLASFLTAGSVSYLFYADRLVQFPLGIFAISAVTVMMPELARQAVAEQLDAMRQTFRQALLLVWFVIVPAMVGLIVLRDPIIALLFERGAFDSNSARLTADALLCYSTGLWAYAALRILLAMFYALQDPYGPLKAAGVCVAANLVIGFLLMQTMGHAGIALAAALAAMLNVFILLIMLRRRIGPIGGRQMLPAALRILGCAALMGGAIHLVNIRFAKAAAGGMPGQIGYVTGCILLGVTVYLGAAWLCRSPELKTCGRLFGKWSKPS
jgi:putative peptidoglycan lipid II flippase